MIRLAKEKDIPKILNLLEQILKIHVQIRPDIFIGSGSKFTEDELRHIFSDKDKAVYVVVNSQDEVTGYVFCTLKDTYHINNLLPMKILHIEDICVDENARGNHIGEELFNHVKELAKKLGCYEITLHVWEGNDAAKHFYQKQGMQAKMSVMELIVK